MKVRLGLGVNYQWENMHTHTHIFIYIYIFQWRWWLDWWNEQEGNLKGLSFFSLGIGLGGKEFNGSAEELVSRQ